MIDEMDFNDRVDMVVAELKELKDLGDPEIAHGMADAALLEFFNSVGRHDVAEAFGAIDKWYA